MQLGRSAQPGETPGNPEEAQLRRPATAAAAQEAEGGRISLGSRRMSGGRVCHGAMSRM